MSQPTEAAPRTPRMPELDGIRGLAILLVIIWHFGAGPFTPESGSIGQVGKNALLFTWSGVDLFFVLSGFLIGGILMDNRASPSYFKTFYLRRFCRILPLYCTWLALYFVMVWLCPPPRFDALLHHETLPFWNYATFTQNFAMANAGTTGPHWLGVTWSLAIEEQFYLVLPLLIRVVSPQRLPVALISLVLLAPIARCVVVVDQPFSNPGCAAHVLALTRADSLFLGVLCAWAIRQENWTAFAKKSSPWLLAAIPTCLAILFFALSSSRFMLGTKLMVVTSYFWLALLYTSVLLLAVSHPSGPIARLARWSPLRHLGIVAYGVYLFHQAVNHIVNETLWHHPPRMESWMDALTSLVSFAITWLLAWWSWQYFEKRFVDWGHRFRYERTAGIG